MVTEIHVNAFFTSYFWCASPLEIAIDSSFFSYVLE